MSKTPEGLIKDLIKKVLDQKDIYYKMIVPHPMGANAGISDFQLHYQGHFIVIEAKPRQGKKKPTPLQAKYMDAIDKAGSISFVVRNEYDMARVIQFLDWADLNPAPKPPFDILRDDLK